MIDELSYHTLQADESFGRYPDGGDLLSLLHLSPGSSNRLITSVDPGEDSTGFRVYPNPATTFLVIEYEAGKVSPCSLMNLNGQTVLRIRLDSGGTTRLDVSGLLPGIYLLSFTGSFSYSAKVIIR